jgi:hypothetical protein
MACPCLLPGAHRLGAESVADRFYVISPIKARSIRPGKKGKNCPNIDQTISLDNN